MPSLRVHILSHRLLPAIVIVFIATIFMLIFPHSARALPEYAKRTNEPCATCHVNPGGGGPRTMRGLLWIADGRPDKVRIFEGILLAPGVSDPQALYDIACAACHGSKGEGGSAPALRGFNFSEILISHRIQVGVPKYGMPAFQGQFTDEQLAVLAKFVDDLSAGRIVPPASYPLAPIKMDLAAKTDAPAPPDYGGN